MIDLSAPSALYVCVLELVCIPICVHVFISRID